MSSARSTSQADDLSRLRGAIQAALDVSPGLRYEDVGAAVERGDMQLWPGHSSAIVTEIVNLPSGEKHLHYILAGGRMDEIEALYPIVEQWGIGMGCSRATMLGREGWQRSFLTRRAGWTPGLRLYEKDLRHVEAAHRDRHQHQRT